MADMETLVCCIAVGLMTTMLKSTTSPGATFLELAR